jgi:hypothetical protein
MRKGVALGHIFGGKGMNLQDIVQNIDILLGALAVAALAIFIYNAEARWHAKKARRRIRRFTIVKLTINRDVVIVQRGAEFYLLDARGKEISAKHSQHNLGADDPLLSDTDEDDLSWGRVPEHAFFRFSDVKNWAHQERTARNLL